MVWSPCNPRNSEESSPAPQFENINSSILSLLYGPTLTSLHESESERCSAMSDSLQPHALYSPWNSPGRNTGVGSLWLLQGNLPNPGIEPRSPTLQVDSLQAEPQGKPKNTGVGSLSLLQGIFLTQGSNRGLLHCRWILYQLNYQGSSPECISSKKN